MTRKREITTAEEFFIHALKIEQEAAESYRVLASQMEGHHNPQCARLFSHLAALEEEHTAGLRKNAQSVDLAKIPPWSYLWHEPESPESTPLDRAHYLMTEHHALTLALNNERRAKDFFDHAATHSPSEVVRSLARQYAAEEQRHIEMVALMLRRVSEPASNWSRDDDEPVEPE
jgi:rubrerythrin